MLLTATCSTSKGKDWLETKRNYFDAFISLLRKNKVTEIFVSRFAELPVQEI